MDAKKGSKIARDGFKNEKDVVYKFNNWKSDYDAQEWLIIMGYDLDEIEYVVARILSGYKTDVQAQITVKLKKLIDVQNIQVKLVSNPIGFNQIDKRWIDKYTEMWNIPKDVVKLLKYFTGEFKPFKKTRNEKRMFIDEFDIEDQEKVINFFVKNKTLILCDIIKGRGKFAAEWMLVAQKTENPRWVLKPINVVLNHYGSGDVKITPRGSIKLGKVTIQRKGGDNNRKTANMLQFKINPTELFDI